MANVWKNAKNIHPKIQKPYIHISTHSHSVYERPLIMNVIMILVFSPYSLLPPPSFIAPCTVYESHTISFAKYMREQYWFFHTFDEESSCVCFLTFWIKCTYQWSMKIIQNYNTTFIYLWIYNDTIYYYLNINLSLTLTKYK